jgi:outer membrane protein OmpA-like peptidoglycan-associated protein
MLRRFQRVGVALASGLFPMLAVISFATPAVAQSEPTPKWDLFVGYQWLHPGGNVPAPFGDPAAPTPFPIPDMSRGFGAAATINFDRHWGLEFDLGHNWGSGNYETTGSAGPRVMARTDGANYFLHALASYNRLAVSGLNPNNGIGAILGGGMDLTLGKRVSLRLFEADYVWSRHSFADDAAPQFPSLRRPTLQGVRLRTGLVFNWGGAPEVTPAVTCSVQPTEVMVGEPITASASAGNFNPKHTVSYSWSGNGGRVTGKEATANIDTSDVAPGSYAVTVHVTDAKAKRNNEASCSANYTVKPLPPKNPPTMSCSASSTSLPIGGSTSITCSCTSPDGVQVTVANWTANNGTISGSGNTATLDTRGASPGSATIGATCTDSRGLTSQASTQIALETPPPPPIPPEVRALEARLALHSVYFPTAQPTVKNPKAGLLSSQQKTLIVLAIDFQKYLQSKPDAHLILEGHADPRGLAAYNQALSERRVDAVKNFLIERGVPAASIETKAFGAQQTLTPDQVRESVVNNTELTTEERARALRNLKTITLASDRRVDITLSTTGQSSVRQFPFNAADSLSLIGGREGEAKKKKVAKPAAKPAPKKDTKKPQ